MSTLKRTIFEGVWDDKPEEHLFKSDKHGVMAAVDAYPRLALQVIVAPRDGEYGNKLHFHSLDPVIRGKMRIVADVMGAKMLENCDADQRVIEHVEGFNIDNHAHMLLAVARRSEGALLYTGPDLGAVAVQNTLQVLRFTPEEEFALEARLNEFSN
jgi:hypothetical protein